MFLFRGNNKSGVSSNSKQGITGGLQGSGRKMGGSTSSSRLDANLRHHHHHHRHGDVKSNNNTAPNDDLLMQVSHLQSEMTRLNLQLASLKGRPVSMTGPFKEERSTERSHRTFSTKETTTHPNSCVLSGSHHPRAATSPRPSLSRMDGYSYVSHGGHSNDRPPPVSQICIPTLVEQESHYHHRNNNGSHRSSNYGEGQPTSMDRRYYDHDHDHFHRRKRTGSPLEYPQQDEMSFEEDDRHPVREVHYRPTETTSSWQSVESSTPSSSVGRCEKASSTPTGTSNRSKSSRGGSKSSSRRVRYRTVRRILSGGDTSSSKPYHTRPAIAKDSPSPPRPDVRGRKVLQLPRLLKGSNSNSAKGKHVPSRVTERGAPPANVVDDCKPSKPTAGKKRFQWPPPQKSEEAPQPTMAKADATTSSTNKIQRGTKGRHQQPKLREADPVKERSPMHVPSKKPNANANARANAFSGALLSQIRKADVKLKQVPAKSTTAKVASSSSSPTSALLLQLQQRKRQCMEMTY